MKIKKYLLKDYEEGFYNVILFEEEIKLEDLEECIKKHKKNNMAEWNIESITEQIKNTFKVKEILMFDYIAGNVGDIVGDSSLEIL